jgi:penicillin-binding protein 1A
MSTGVNSWIKWLWVLVIVGVLFAMAVVVLVSYTKMPDTEELENPQYEQASIIYSRDGEREEIGRWFSYNRKWVDNTEINSNIINALVSTEDERFYGHAGIDVKSTIRAFIFMGKKGGASTITQQLAKLFFTPQPGNSLKRIWQKLKEWVIAVQFEKRYTKQEIIAMYLNKFDFLYDSSGIAAAANTYYGKDQKDLNIIEAATLVGMLKNPDLYNPKKYPENSLRRRNVVLNQMRKNKFLTEEEYKELSNEVLDNSSFKRSVHYDGAAPYFRASLSKYVNKILKDKKIAKADGTSYNIYRDGLKVYTTIDMKMQRHAEKAMRNHMSNLQKRYFTVWKGLDPWTYDADENQSNIRKSSLNRLIRESERYKQLKQVYMAEIFSKITDAFPDSRHRDADINRMMSEAQKEGHLRGLVNRKVITKKQSRTYKDIMDSNLWPELESQWVKLNKATRNAFNKKQTMKVFTYEGNGEKTMEMTPLDSIKYHRMHMQLGSVSIEPSTGFVRTWVGGIGNKYYKYDHISSNRQVGSTFKPFIYGTAISQQALSPCQRIKDMQYSIPANDPNFGLMKSWSPSNSSGKFSGESVTMLEALKRSLNSVSVKLMIELGNTSQVVDLASSMGIDRKKIPNYPSICLGTPEVSVLEMTGAYATFANDGVYTKPVFVERIEDKNGKQIYNAVPEKRRALNPKYNFAMVEMLQYAASFVKDKLEIDFGGKTGTTNDYVDGWFMGITPELVVGTWVGGEDPWIRFLSLADGQGGVMARPFFLDFMQRVEGDNSINFNSEAKFLIPQEELIVTDCSQYDQIKSTPTPDRKVISKPNDEEFEEEEEEFEEESDEFGEEG